MRKLLKLRCPCYPALAARLAKYIALIFLYGGICWADVAPAYTDGELTTRDHLYKLITGGFGALVIIFCGLGGFATLMMRREGKAGSSAPMLGIVMLIVSGAVFVYRVLIKSGFLGQEYLEF